MISLTINIAVRQADFVTMTYVEPDGTEKQVKAEIGKNLLDVAHDNDVELEGTSFLHIPFHL